MKTSLQFIVHSSDQRIPYSNILGCTFKLYLKNARQQLLHPFHFIYVIFSGTLALQIITRYFSHYISAKYGCITEFFEKPYWLLFPQYRITPLHLHLKQWRIANEHKSMAHVRYAEKPKHPE